MLWSFLFVRLVIVTISAFFQFPHANVRIVDIPLVLFSFSMAILRILNISIVLLLLSIVNLKICDFFDFNVNFIC